MKNVFIIGSKGIPANYGGFETFVEYLTKYKVSDDIKYHVACLSDHSNHYYILLMTSIKQMSLIQPLFSLS